MKIIGCVKTVETNGECDRKITTWLFFMKIGRFLGCHQMYSRSFFIRGYQFPVCARCTGVFVGEIIAIPLVFFLKIKILWCLLLLIPMAADWTVQRFLGMESTNIRRFFTGIFAGFGLTFVHYSIICFIISLFVNREVVL